MVESACAECGQTYQARDGRQKYCDVPCRKIAATRRAKTFYDRNPDYNRDKSRRHREKNGYTPWPAKRALGLEIAQIKIDTPCMDCGNNYPQECMDFDHRPGESKQNNVGTMVSHGHGRESVMAEIAKCDIVCANCHRIRTRKRRDGS